ncbi:MAG: enoyl-CoA hydratase [Rhodospirillaceae bacterium]|nr:enoyl-CoA hydratase [Rhodospirillaceae bacterium]|tara:strand:- start:1261 stop:2067 length:807 start_codon:yes stop_codon:yes gene_type:complete
MPEIIKTGSNNLLASIDGQIGKIIFNKPEKHNAVCIKMWKSLKNILEEFNNTKSLRVIMLAGAGEKAFISGADISEFEKTRTEKKDVFEYDKIAEGATQILYESTKPTIAVIQGYCIGGGLGIAAACDIRIASENATFAIPAAKLGLGYRSKNLQRVVQLVGPSFATEIIVTARQFNVQEAYEMGLVNRVVKHSQLNSFSGEYADSISNNAPMTIFAAKTAIRYMQQQNHKFDDNYLNSLVDQCFSSEDYAEGRNAFREKRKPTFSGK